MTTWVVDASVAAKWYRREHYTPQAEGLLGAGIQLHVPDLFFAEMGNVVWKWARRGEQSTEDGSLVLAELAEMPLSVHDSRTLLDQAFRLAHGHGRTLYDSLYLALALHLETRLVTADERFRNAFQDGPLTGAIVWIGDLPD